MTISFETQEFDLDAELLDEPTYQTALPGLHEKSCKLCMKRNEVEDDVLPLTAEDYVEEIYKVVAPDFAQTLPPMPVSLVDPRPTLVSLVSDDGTFRRDPTNPSIQLDVTSDDPPTTPLPRLTPTTSIAQIPAMEPALKDE